MRKQEGRSSLQRLEKQIFSAGGLLMLDAIAAWPRTATLLLVMTQKMVMTDSGSGSDEEEDGGSIADDGISGSNGS
jgi:hypothetical protein